MHLAFLLKDDLIFNLKPRMFYLRIDIWDDNFLAYPASRSDFIGSTFIEGVCSNQQYSIIEFAGFNSISNAAHDLGHK